MIALAAAGYCCRLLLPQAIAAAGYCCRMLLLPQARGKNSCRRLEVKIEINNCN